MSNRLHLYCKRMPQQDAPYKSCMCLACQPMRIIDEHEARIAELEQTISELIAANKALAESAQGFKVHCPAVTQSYVQRLRDSRPQDWPGDFHLENGNYYSKCRCGRDFTGHKRRVVCRICAALNTDD